MASSGFSGSQENIKNKKEPLDNLRRSEMKKSFIESKIISQNEVEKNKNNLDNNNISLSITIDNSSISFSLFSSPIISFVILSLF